MRVDVVEQSRLLPWERSHNGYRWFDMPGQGETNKKLNFYLFRIGKLLLEEVKMELELEGELPVEVTVVKRPHAMSVNKLGQRALGRLRTRRLRVVKDESWGSSPALHGGGKRVQKAREKSLEQVEMVERYKALAGKINRMDSPRAMMIAEVRKLGATAGAFCSGVEKGGVWGPKMMGIVRKAMEVLERHVVEVVFVRGRVTEMLAVFDAAHGKSLRMLTLCAACKVSDQAVKDFRAGETTCLATLKKLEAGLIKLGCAETEGGVRV
jgi:hypothetical protein